MITKELVTNMVINISENKLIEWLTFKVFMKYEIYDRGFTAIGDHTLSSSVRLAAPLLLQDQVLNVKN